MSNPLSPALRAAALVVLVAALCLVLSPAFPWLAKWPAALTLPAADWIGALSDRLVALFKPLARAVGAVISHPMDWAGKLLIATPYPLTIGLFTAAGWRLGGWPMAAGVLVGLGFVQASGYWLPGMTTLSLVAVAVPLALVAGGATGIIAYKVPALRGTIQIGLDIMQTIPTFAYLTPLLLLLGFGPVVGLIASAIYAAPPIARNVLLGLERVDPDIREAAVMNGATPMQQLFLIELPSAARQIWVGVNQTIMAALSMVIIAAVIGGFNDIGWAVLLTMRKADFGNSLIAGLVIVIFAVIIDRLSGSLGAARPNHSARIGWVIVAVSAVLGLWVVFGAQDAAPNHTMMEPVAAWLNRSLGEFIASYGPWLTKLKTNAMIYLLLPLRIGLDHAVTPATWGFVWTPLHGAIHLGLALILSLVLLRTGRPLAALLTLIAAYVLLVGIAQLPWPFVLVGVAALGWSGGGWSLAAFVSALLVTIMVMGLWEPALLSIYLSGTAVLLCATLGGAIGIACAVSPPLWRIVRPICDLLQTIPMFVFLIPVLMFFQIGEFSALLAICSYAIVPMIRYTHQGVTSTPEEQVEAAISAGASPFALLTEIRIPSAAPVILLGLNQTILYAFSMLVIAALIGTTDLGQQIYLALGQGKAGMGIAAGAAMAMLALVADRLVQAFAAKSGRELGH